MSGSRFSSYESYNVMPEEQSSSYYPVNVYSTNFGRKNEQSAFLRWCCCCKNNSNETDDLLVENSTSSLIRSAERRSYILEKEIPTTAVQSVPTITITSTADLESQISKSTTELLLSSEQRSSTISLNTPQYTVPKFKISPPESSKGPGTPSISIVEKRGEKISFIREVISCRDSFLKSLEWCDNSLTRKKRCRVVKPDEWLELKEGDAS